MAVIRLLNLLTISCLALIASLAPAPATALSVDTNLPRHNLHHAIAAKNKRATSSKRCKPRSTSASAPALTSSKTSSTPKPTKTSSPSSAPASGKPAPSNGSGAGKVGLAWPLGDDKSIQNFKTWKVSKYYTWSPRCFDAATDVGLDCCPMLWGANQASDFSKLVKPGYAKYALGMNEPNQAGQSDMSPGDAVNLWRQYLDPLKNHGYTLVSPACTNAPSGKTWMQQFLDQCNGCQVDAIGTHYYGTSPDEFISHMEDLHNTFGKDLWITEYACQNFSGGPQCSSDQVVDFMRKVTAWMDQTDYVTVYFAFGLMHDMNGVNPANQLLANNGQPTTLGELYIGNSF